MPAYRKPTGAEKRLTWNPSLQFPFESGWSIFQKIKVLNNINGPDLARLISQGEVPAKRNRLNDCADSSWINFSRFSELLGVPIVDLKNGFWDQLGFNVERPKHYELRHCPICWELYRYHCVIFDLAWLTRCPIHGAKLGLPRDIVIGTRDVDGYGEQPEASFDELLELAPMESQEKHLLIGCILEYLEWWRAVQARVPEADFLLSSLVSTSHRTRKSAVLYTWQAGFALKEVPLRYGTWILENVPPMTTRYARIVDAGRSKLHTDHRNTVRDETGVAYRAIRRHVFRRHVRRHRKCLIRLYQLSRDDCLSLAADGVCATCLAYVVWRMSIERLAVMDGLFTERNANYDLRLIEPWPDSPSDNPTRLGFTYMHFFGLWAAILEGNSVQGVNVTLEQTVSSPQVVFARGRERPLDAPLRFLHCIYPDGIALALKAGQPCKAPWTLLSPEKQCAIRTQEWLNSTTPSRLTMFQLHSSGKMDIQKISVNLWV